MFAGFTSRWTTSCRCAYARPVGNLRGDVGDALRRQHDARVEDLAQRAPVEELHRDVRGVPGLADVVDRDDVRMVEAPGGLRFAEEAALVRLGLGVGQPEADRLDRDQAVDQRIARLVHDTHGAAARVPRESRSGRAPRAACSPVVLYARAARSGRCALDGAHERRASAMAPRRNLRWPFACHMGYFCHTRRLPELTAGAPIGPCHH